MVTYHIARNLWARLRLLSGNYKTKSGTKHKRLNDCKASLDYIQGVFQDYLTYAELDPRRLRDKQVLEIGPGDNFGIAINFLLHGARKVVSLDRFYSERDFGKQKDIYLAMREALPPEKKRFFDENIGFNDDNNITVNPDIFTYVSGYGIETADRFLEKNSFDFIVSRAVMEHVFNVEAAFEVMDKLLKPGGYLIHKIDFRDHGMFSGAAQNHPLTFLTIPNPVYRLMISHSGKPNRFLFGDYARLLEKLNYPHKMFVTHLVGKNGDLKPHPDISRLRPADIPESLELVQSVRPKLSSRFRAMPEKDLAVSGIFLAARKPF